MVHVEIQTVLEESRRDGMYTDTFPAAVSSASLQQCLHLHHHSRESKPWNISTSQLNRSDDEYISSRISKGQ